MLNPYGKCVRCRVKPLTHCKDGTTLSIQDSCIHYCEPRTCDAFHTHCEVGYIRDKEGKPVVPPESWGEPGSVYEYVPVGDIVEFIEAHGGIDDSHYQFEEYTGAYDFLNVMNKMVELGAMNINDIRKIETGGLE